jgi:hypothetical protein
MTIMRTVLSTSMIALGVMLAVLAWGAGPPLPQEPSHATALSAGSSNPADFVPMARMRNRTRFVAADGETKRTSSPPNETAAARIAHPLARKHAAKTSGAPKEKRPLQRPAPVPRPQATSLQWPWASWFK